MWNLERGRRGKVPKVKGGRDSMSSPNNEWNCCGVPGSGTLSWGERRSDVLAVTSLAWMGCATRTANYSLALPDRLIRLSSTFHT